MPVLLPIAPYLFNPFKASRIMKERLALSLVRNYNDNRIGYCESSRLNSWINSILRFSLYVNFHANFERTNITSPTTKKKDYYAT